MTKYEIDSKAAAISMEIERLLEEVNTPLEIDSLTPEQAEALSNIKKHLEGANEEVIYLF